MSNAIAFDTHAVIKRLESAGASEELAEAISSVAQEAAMARMDELVTKADLRDQMAPVHAQIILLKWMVGFNLTLTAAVFARLFLG